MTVKGIIYTILIFLSGCILSNKFFSKITSIVTAIFAPKNDNNSSVIFLNTPINSTEEDKVGVSYQVDSLKHAIQNKAQMIAITSDFSGGKSSLISLLSKELSKRSYKSNRKIYSYKLCKINLWSKTTTDNDASNNVLAIHKNFLYLLAMSIKPALGAFVQKEIDEKFFTFKASFKSNHCKIATIVCIIGIIISALLNALNSNSETLPLIFSALEPVYTTTTKWHILEISIIALIVVMIYVIYNSGISFSHIDNTTSVSESELMDLYYNYVLKSRKPIFRKHFVIVIEDLDRTKNPADVYQFLKELRKYYILENNKRNNNVTFIVNLKPEAILLNDESKNDRIYPKIFDFILNLQPINIDNYDVILEGILDDRKDVLINLGVINPLTATNKFKGIDGADYLVKCDKNDNITIRDIKERLNTSVTIYRSLIAKFSESKSIEFRKCAVAAYITNKFPVDFYSTPGYVFDELINAYIKGDDPKDIFLPFTQKKTDENAPDKAIIVSKFSETYMNEIIELICNKQIDSDFRTYFYNYPKDSYLYTLNERKVRDAILYDSSVSHEATKEVFDKNYNLIKSALDKYYGLNGKLPKVVFNNEYICIVAVEQFFDIFINDLNLFLSKDKDNHQRALAKIEAILHFDHERKHITTDKIERIANEVINRLPSQQINLVRFLIIEQLQSEIRLFKDLFIKNNILNGKEIDGIESLENIMLFANAKHIGFTIETLHMIISKFDFTKDNLEIFVNYLLEFKTIFSTTELCFEYIYFAKHINLLPNDLEHYIIEAIEEDSFDRKHYINLINYIPDDRINPSTLNNIKNLEIRSGINYEKCQVLYANEYYLEYIFNMLHLNNTLNFYDKNISNTIIDNHKEIYRYSNNFFMICRYGLVEVYRHQLSNINCLFANNYPIITDQEARTSVYVKQIIETLDCSRLTESDIEYLASRFSSSSQSKATTVKIFVDFIFKLNADYMEYAFDVLNFSNLKYSKISERERTAIREEYEELTGLKNITDKLKFMEHTQCVDKSILNEFLAYVKKYGSDTGLYKKLYAVLSKLEEIEKYASIIVEIINSDEYYREFSNSIDEILFNNSMYNHYLYSKTSKSGSFIPEQDPDRYSKIESTYEKIILTTNTEMFENTICKNKKLIEKMMSERKYVEAKDFNCRKRFTIVLQTVECLKELFDNYEIEEIAVYLKDIAGFADKESATFFVERIRSLKALLGDIEIYNNTHEKLLDGNLKSKYTRSKNKMINS